MTTLVEELSQRARKLSAEDRARLADDLLASLEAEPMQPQAEVDAAWAQEVSRRADEVRSGRAKTVPADEVYAETRRLYR
jgi:putative addiction module component (TIGR02574 family)